MKIDFSVLTRNFPTKIIALILAVAIWIIAFSDNNSGVAAPKVDVVVEVQLEFKNVPSDMEVVDRQQQIMVHVKSTQEQQKNIGDAVSSFVDLSGEKAGQRTLPVQTVLPQGVELVSVEPSRVIVEVQNVESKKFDVQPAVLSGSGGTMVLGNFTVTPDQVTLEGTSQELAMVSKVMAVTDMERLETGVDICDVLVMDEYGNTLNDEISVYPNAVTIKGSTFDYSYLKKVPVHAKVATSGDANIRIEKIELSNQEVVICATPEVLASITNLQTKTVVVDKSGSNVYYAELDLPSGVFAPDGNVVELTVTTSDI